jgi:hypothetical protein
MLMYIELFLRLVKSRVATGGTQSLPLVAVLLSHSLCCMDKGFMWTGSSWMVGRGASDWETEVGAPETELASVRPASTPGVSLSSAGAPAATRPRSAGPPESTRRQPPAMSPSADGVTSFSLHHHYYHSRQAPMERHRRKHSPDAPSTPGDAPSDLHSPRSEGTSSPARASHHQPQHPAHRSS